MSGGAGAAAARKFFDGDADAILMTKGIEDDFIKLPFAGTGLLMGTGTGPTFKTGGHAYMVPSSLFPGEEFVSNGAGKKNAEFVELACGALLESQLQHGGLPGRNYPRTLLIGPRAAFTMVKSGMVFGTATWSDDAKFAEASELAKKNVYDYDRIVIVNHYDDGDKPLSSVVITVADLDQSAATDAGKVPALVYTAGYSFGPTVLPYKAGFGALTQMSRVLTKLGHGDTITLPKVLAHDKPFVGLSDDYHKWAVLALERVMRVASPVLHRGEVALRLFALSAEQNNLVLMERAVRSGFIPPRTLLQNPVAWPVPTTQDNVVALMNERLGYGKDAVTLGSAVHTQDAVDSDALDAIARTVLGQATAATHTYDAFVPNEEAWY